MSLYVPRGTERMFLSGNIERMFPEQRNVLCRGTQRNVLSGNIENMSL